MAVADDELLALKAALMQIVDNEADRACRAARFALDLDRAFGTADADAPHAELFGDKSGELAHSPVFDEIVKAGEGKHGFHAVDQLFSLRVDGFKGKTASDHLRNMAEQKRDRRTGRDRIKNGDLFVRLLSKDELLCAHGAVVAAGKVGGDRHGNGLLRLFELLRPDVRGGTGGAAELRAAFHRVKQSFRIQTFTVHIFLFADTKSKRHGRKAERLAVEIAFDKIAGGVRHNVPLHRFPSFQAFFMKTM